MLLATMSVSRSFELQVQPLGEGTLITIAGTLDESARLQTAVAQAKAPVTVDLASVRLVDSVGVREWVDFLRALPRPVTLRRCAEPMVFQFGVVPETLQDARVESVLAPYECEVCGVSRRLEVPLGEHEVLATLRLPEPRCEACQGRQVLAEHPERYFCFLE